MSTTDGVVTDGVVTVGAATMLDGVASTELEGRTEPTTEPAVAATVVTVAPTVDSDSGMPPWPPPVVDVDWDPAVVAGSPPAINAGDRGRRASPATSGHAVAEQREQLRPAFSQLLDAGVLGQ